MAICKLRFETIQYVRIKKPIDVMVKTQTSKNGSDPNVATESAGCCVMGGAFSITDHVIFFRELFIYCVF